MTTRAPAAWRPAFNTMTGLTLAATRMLDISGRAFSIPSKYSRIERVAASPARKSRISATETSDSAPVATTDEKPNPAVQA